MVVNIVVISTKIEFMVMVYIYGMMVDNTKVIGKIIKWRDMEFTYGKMVENMKVSIIKTKNMEKGSILGLMAGHIRDNGRMENNMV